ncbi:hypothetical protein ACFLTY_06110 [Chloroflexota bacterium]
MSCYLRHIKDILDEAGVAVTPGNKKRIDQAIHQAVGITYKSCPATWKKIKEDVKVDQERRCTLIKQLQIAMR